ncbi:MAG: GNAT family N-acetyltransferase [Jatrophihabitantaceae bacterium]
MSDEAARALDVENLWRCELHGVQNFSVIVRLAGQEIVSLSPGRRFSGASMIKTLIAVVLVRSIATGTLRWESVCEVTATMRAPGDGVLAGFELPVELSAADACFLMLAISDNTATNALIELLGGLSVVNDSLAALGLHSRVRRWVGGGEQDPRGVDWTADSEHVNAAGLSLVIPAEHDWAIRSLLHDYGLHSVRVSAMLRGQQDRRSLARYLEAEAEFAHKTGTVDGVRHDGGLLFGADGGQLEVTVFSDGPPRSENVDDTACSAMARGFARTLERLGWLDRLDENYGSFWQPPLSAGELSVRPVGSDDATKTREIRLRMLRDTPEAFLERYDEVVQYPIAEWIRRSHEWSAAQSVAAFASVDRWGRWWGFAAGRVVEDRVLLYAMFVDPAVRGRSLQIGGRLIQAIGRWSRERNRSFVILWVLESNGRACGLYKRVGFNFTGQERPYAFDNRLTEHQMISKVDHIVGT